MKEPDNSTLISSVIDSIFRSELRGQMFESPSARMFKGKSFDFTKDYTSEDIRNFALDLILEKHKIDIPKVVAKYQPYHLNEKGTINFTEDGIIMYLPKYVSHLPTQKIEAQFKKVIDNITDTEKREFAKTIPVDYAKDVVLLQNFEDGVETCLALYGMVIYETYFPDQEFDFGNKTKSEQETRGPIFDFAGCFRSYILNETDSQRHNLMKELLASIED